MGISWLCLVASLIFDEFTHAVTVDNELIAVKNECFERISLGSRLSGDVLIRPPIPTNNLRECEGECSALFDDCNTISFGISSKGNGSCDISKLRISSSNLISGGSISDPDYDIFAKRTNCPPKVNTNRPDPQEEILLYGLRNSKYTQNYQIPIQHYDSAPIKPVFNDLYNVDNTDGLTYGQNYPHVQQEIKYENPKPDPIYFDNSYDRYEGPYVSDAPQPLEYHEKYHSPQPSRPVYGDDQSNGGIFDNTREYINEPPYPVTGIYGPQQRACFRRLLAGKRVAPHLVLRRLVCERVEDCHRECGDERRFDCEGFNYRLDPSGRGQGDCELTGKPLAVLDLGRDFYPDKDYDYYERDRNSLPGCGANYHESYSSGYEGHYSSGGLRPDGHGYGGGYPDDRHLSYYDSSYRDHHTRGGSSHYYGGDNYGRPDDRYPHRSHESSSYDDQYVNNYNKDSYNHYSHQTPVFPFGPYEPYERHRNRDHFSGSHRQQFVPYNFGVPQDKYWGVYGGFYGNGYDRRDTQRYNYWGLDQHNNNYDYYHRDNNYGVRHYENERIHPVNRSDRDRFDYFSLGGRNYHRDNVWGISGGYGQGGRHHYHHDDIPNRFHGRPDYEDYRYNDRDFPKERPYYIGDDRPQQHPRYECATRTKSGFRLEKAIVVQSFIVPNIRECERICKTSNSIRCESFCYRYSLPPQSPGHNCYLTDRPHRELDVYINLEPDRDFDIYTMTADNAICEKIPSHGFGESECFLRVRSGQRLSHSVVRDSLNVPSIGQCEVECIKSRRFTCRLFSFRYGSPVIGGTIDNCQLSDWPFSDLDFRIHLVEDAGYELYERGSFGHGCEIERHGGDWPHDTRNEVDHKNNDKLCYLGYGSPARLLPSAVRKVLYVPTELDCKTECSTARESSPLRCMAFSYRSESHHIDRSPNCELSDIDQRDLKLNLDYEHEDHYWLFAWNIFDERCERSDRKQLDHGRPSHGHNSVANTWQHYTVSGKPCRHGGGGCQENRVAGFFSCETEDSEVGSWDYCCAPDHHCGYSEGYNYAWCYVGSSKTQWRTCNDRYFPYRPPTSNKIPPLISHRPQRPLVPQRPYNNDRFPILNHDKFRPTHQAWVQNDPINDHFHSPPQHHSEVFLPPPKPGGLVEARYWPVAYLHSENPPNATFIESPLQGSNKHFDRLRTKGTLDNLTENLRSGRESTKQPAEVIGNTKSKNGNVQWERVRTEKPQPKEVIEFDVVDDVEIDDNSSATTTASMKALRYKTNGERRFKSEGFLRNTTEFRRNIERADIIF